MKVYTTLLIPCGELRNDMNPEILGTYKTKEKAIARAMQEYEQDNKTNFYIAANYDLKEFNKTLFLQVFWRYTENYNCYYELFVMESEVK